MENSSKSKHTLQGWNNFFLSFEIICDFFSCGLAGFMWIFITLIFPVGQNKNPQEDLKLGVESTIIISYIVFIFFLNSVTFIFSAQFGVDFLKRLKPMTIFTAAFIYSSMKLLAIFIIHYTVRHNRSERLMGVGLAILFALRFAHFFTFPIGVVYLAFKNPGQVEQNIDEQVEPDYFVQKHEQLEMAVV